MFVEKLDCPWEQTPFMFQGFRINTMEEIRTIQKYSPYAYISIAKSRGLRRDPSDLLETSAAAQKNKRNFLKWLRNLFRGKSKNPNDKYDLPVLTSEDKLSYAADLGQAKEIWTNTKLLIDTMHDDVKRGGNVDFVGSKKIVGELTQSIMHNPYALLWLTNLKNKDEYTAIHSINVCILSIYFGKHLRISNDGLLNLGLGALLHDIGKIRVPPDILNKPGKLTEQEFDVMKQHPLYGVKFLERHEKKLDSSVFHIVGSHHERINGKGYMQGLKREEIKDFVKIVSIVDVYDAISSNRVYRDARPVHEVIQFMNSRRNIDFDSFFMEKFIECIGVYQIGSLVELNTGDVGMIVSHDVENPKRPTLLLLMDKDKNDYYPLRVLNLKLFERREFYIVKGLPEGAYGINTEDYLQEITADI